MKIFFNIKSLGAIRNSRIEFKPLMIFSGDSSLGKSYTAFIVYYFIKLFTDGRINLFIKNHISKELFTQDQGVYVFNIQDFKRWINHDLNVFLGYLVGLESFSSDVDIEFEFNDDIVVKFHKISDFTDDESIYIDERIRLEISGKVYNVPKSIFEDDGIDSFGSVISRFFKEELFKKSSLFETLFLPPSRAAFAGMNLSSPNNLSTDLGMYQEYLSDMAALNRVSDERFYPSKNTIKLLDELIDGDILSEKGNLYYKFKENKIPLSSAASSIKELAPIFMLLKKFEPNDFSVLFEEPEAHTHPKMQVKLANLISYLVNNGAFFQITTHSDYFLNQLNNLIKLGKLDKENKSDICKKYNINPKNILKDNLIGSYYFSKIKDGTVQIVEQNIDKGVPFSTFESTVDELLDFSEAIEDYLN